MRACEGAGCELCGCGVGRQIRYLVCCAEVTTGRVGVLEVGRAPGLQLRDRVQGNGGLRGAVFEVCRAARSKHSRLELVFVDEHPGSHLLSLEPLDLESVLRSTWEKAGG